MIANGLSGVSPQETEWYLDASSFERIQLIVLDLLIYLFAMRLDNKLLLYVAPNIGPKAVEADAMSLDWNRWTSIYLFPPTNLLLKALAKLRSFRGTAALVAPNGPTVVDFLSFRS